MRAAIVAALSAALCGCTDASVIHHNYYNSAYAPSQVDLASANNPSLAVIRNNPFPEDRDNDGVLAAMQGRNLGQRMYFSQTPRPDDKYGYKVILNFGTESPSGSYAPMTYVYSECQLRPTPPSTTSDRGNISVFASFCVGDLLLTDASGSIGAATGPDDPHFRRLIGDIMVALTPPYIPHGGHRCNTNC